MNALELADLIDETVGGKTATTTMLRKQYEAIVKLREALEGSVAYAELLEKRTYRHPDASQIKSKQALKDTEGLK